MNPSFGTIAATCGCCISDPSGLGTGHQSTEYEQIRGARDLNHNQSGVAEATI